MPQLRVRVSCLLGPGMQALGDATSLLAGARQAIRSLFSVSILLAAAVAAAADRVNTAVELVKSSDSSLIHS